MQGLPKCFFPKGRGGRHGEADLLQAGHDYLQWRKACIKCHTNLAIVHFVQKGIGLGQFCRDTQRVGGIRCIRLSRIFGASFNRIGAVHGADAHLHAAPVRRLLQSMQSSVSWRPTSAAHVSARHCSLTHDMECTPALIVQGHLLH
jgi:hypothetical protein